MTDQNNQPSGLFYPVLTPIKFLGVIIKPPCFIQLTFEEAAPMIAAGLINAGAAMPPEEAAAASIQMATRPDATTTTSEANPAGGAPPAGKAAARKAVVRPQKK